MVVRAAAIVAALAASALGLGAGAGVSAFKHDCAKTGELRFRAADGTRLAAHRFGKGTAAVVLAHQTRSDLCQWVPYARRLAGLGYLAIALDFRGAGESQNAPFPSRRYAGDVAAAAKVARGLGAKKVFLVGASIGASAVLVAGANVRPPVDGVVSLSGGAGFLGADVAVKRLTVPVLFVAGKDDTGFGSYPDEAQQLYDATASPDKTLRIVPGVDHGVQLMSRSREARALVEDFLRLH